MDGTTVEFIGTDGNKNKITFNAYHVDSIQRNIYCKI